MTLKSLHLSVLLAGLMAAGFASAQAPARGDNTDNKVRAGAMAAPAATSGTTRAEVKSEARSGMTTKTGEAADLGAPKLKAKTRHMKARHHMRSGKMKRHTATRKTAVKTGEAADLGKK